MSLPSSARLLVCADALLICAVVALAAPWLPAAAAEWTGGGLPAAIAKPRPSADVPADLPGSGSSIVAWPVIASPMLVLPPPPPPGPPTAYRPFAPPATHRPSTPTAFTPPMMERAPVDLVTPRPIEADR